MWIIGDTTCILSNALQDMSFAMYDILFCRCQSRAYFPFIKHALMQLNIIPDFIVWKWYTYNVCITLSLYYHLS